MSTTVFAADPSITYSQNAWNVGPGGSMYNTRPNGTAELSFAGNFVNVFGTIPPVESGSARPVSTYILDNNSTSLVVFDSTNTSSEGTLSYAFYQSPQLVDGNHSLLITSLESQTNFILDTIVFGSNILNSSVIPSPSSTPSISSSSSHSSLPTANSDASSSRSNLPVGGIVGGMIAALVFLVMAALIIFCRRRRRKASSLETQSDTDYPPTPEPFLLGSRFEARSGLLTGDSREGSIVSAHFPSGLNANSDPSSNSVILGSIPYSISTTSTVVGDRSETSYLDEKDGCVSGDSSLTPVTPALNYRSTAVSTGSRSTWNTGNSGPPPSWGGLSDAPPSYISTK